MSKHDYNLTLVTWYRSSFSNGTGGNCVEVADLPDGHRAVRDSKLGDDSPVLIFTRSEMAAFAAGAAAGEFA